MKNQRSYAYVISSLFKMEAKMPWEIFLDLVKITYVSI